MKWAIRIIGGVMVLFIGYLVYLGGFKRITIAEKDMGPYVMVYKDYIGDYNKTGERINSFMIDLNNAEFNTAEPFTIFLDAPGTVSAAEQRSQVGAVLSLSDSSKISNLDPSFKVMLFPKQECAVGTFPFRHKISPWIGIAKVYPAMNEFFKKKNTSMEELYSLEIYGSEQITYIIPKSQ